MFKSSEEREAARREREAAEAQAEAERAEQERRAAEERERAQWLASPLGAATAAMEAGQAFFEIQLQVGAHTGSAGFGSTDSRRSVASSAAILGEIENSAGGSSTRATTWSPANPARCGSLSAARPPLSAGSQ